MSKNRLPLYNHGIYLNSSHTKIVMENSDFSLGELLGTGTFGEVYSFFDDECNEIKALKIEKKDSNLLRNEYKIYRYLNKVKNNYIPTVSYYGHVIHKGSMCNVMIMDYLGPSLQKLYNSNNKKFNEVTVVKLAINMINTLEFLHSRHFVHRDIKPDNFVFGRNKDRKNLYLIDLGLAKKYRSSSTYLHIPEKTGKSLIGTARYASINVHNGNEQSRRDDLESLGYCLLFFVLGKLPWQGLKGSTKDEKHNMIKEVKENTNMKKLCKDLHPCFYEYIKYVRELEFKHMPDYEYLRGLFDSALYEMAESLDVPYEWEKDQVEQQKK